MSEQSFRTIMMKMEDNVAVALIDIPQGTELTVNCEGKSINLTLKKDIKFGHKFAVTSITKGENIIKYGEIIGCAVNDIAQGEHVHVHNLEGTRGRGDKIARS